ncbi:hypothetical protein QFC20_003284 [Naganishia adeliensis]|uniref:Uncharacterized protein n=1 Tax=Naganishia adeliensis TaxID=92952 RepID=A0ACC2WCR3_9TREE|nr:hypothetical protein QFC20_003284 [Naganishia adeliensis]
MSSRLLHDYPSLASYSEEQLKDLLTNDELLEAFLYSLPAVQGVLEHQQQLSKANDELAKKNLALQGELIALRAATASAYSTAQHLKDRWKEVEQKQAGLYSKYRPSFLHLRLRHATSDQDALTESIASSFIESSTSVTRGPSRVDSPASAMLGGPGSRIRDDGIESTTGMGDTAMSLEDFIRTFKAARKVYHKRAIWCERWSRGEVAWRED